MTPPFESPSTQLRNELMAVIVRYGKESDVSVYAAVGALEVVKADLLEILAEATEQQP